MAGQVPPMISYGTIPVFGQNVPVPVSYAFVPGNAVGPIASGPGSAPIATLPAGIGPVYGRTSGSPAAIPSGAAGVAGSLGSGSGGTGMGGAFSLRTGLILAGMFVVGILILDRVHWRG